MENAADFNEFLEARAAVRIMRALLAFDTDMAAQIEQLKQRNGDANR